MLAALKACGIRLAIFLSSNRCYALVAPAFGFRVPWYNCLAQAPENIPSAPDGEIMDLSVLPGALVT